MDFVLIPFLFLESTRRLLPFVIRAAIVGSLVIGVTGVAITGGSYQLFKFIKKKKQKVLIIRILKETRKDLFPILKYLADMRGAMGNQFGGRKFLPKHITDKLLLLRNLFFVVFSHLRCS